VHYYASGYYAAAKRQRLERIGHPEPVLAGRTAENKLTKVPADANARQIPKKVTVMAGPGPPQSTSWNQK